MASRQKQRHWARKQLEVPVCQKQSRESSPISRTVVISGGSKPELKAPQVAPKELTVTSGVASPRISTKTPAPTFASSLFPPIQSGDSYEGIHCVGWGQDVTLGFPSGGGVVLFVG